MVNTISWIKIRGLNPLEEDETAAHGWLELWLWWAVVLVGMVPEAEAGTGAGEPEVVG